MIQCIDAGCVPYAESLRWQKKLAERRRKEEVYDHLILLEHPPVYTIGRRDASSDLLRDEKWIRAHGMSVYKTDRGGRVTYHGPGQLVGYLVFGLKGPIPDLVHKIEETLIGLLSHFHLEGEEKGFPGVWVHGKKVAALGLHVDRKVTTHGLSLNVTCDLEPFRYILPCGIKDCEVTSLEKELDWRPPMRDVKHRLLEEVARVFRDNVAVEGAYLYQPE